MQHFILSGVYRLKGIKEIEIEKERTKQLVRLL
jgi:hypothetical protein